VTICDPAGSCTGEAYHISGVRVYSVLPIYIKLDQELKFLYKKNQIPSERLCRAIRMFEIKTEEMGRKGCIMLSCIIYSACHILEL
jgi:hypothetical protein